VPTSVLEVIPPTVLAGLALGGVFTLFATALFALGERLFPSDPVSYADETATYSSEQRRRQEIRRYLGEIGERYAEEYPLEGTGTRVAFYLPERDVAVTFDPQTFFRIQNISDTYVILAEHEMPGVHLGHRLPFEVPEIEREPAMTAFQSRVRTAYQTLGVSSTANSDEIRDAYRERVKQVHPDRGGDEAAFREVQEAYATVKEHAD